MQSSSLIFVVVVAIWAVYLVQYWVRRRDHLATVRSVDRFSAAMRVLDSHRLSQTEEPARSYAVSPARPARPEVVVKRTVADVAPAQAHEAPAPPEVERPAVAEGRGALVSTVVDAPRKVRGIALLVHLALLPVTLLVAAFGGAAWWLPLVVLVGLLGSFGWLRQDVRASEAARREEARARRLERPTPSAPVRARAARPRQVVAEAHASEDRVPELRTDVTATDAARPESAETEVVATVLAEISTGDAPFDIAGRDAAPVAAEPEAPARPAAVAEPGTWEPVPVPRPTYTMKAKAEPRVAPTTVDPTVPQALPAVDDDEDIVAPSGLGERRVVVG